MTLQSLVPIIGVIALAGVTGGCGRERSAQEAPESSQGSDLSKALSEASRTDPDPVYSQSLRRLRSKVIDLENRAAALHRAAENLTRPDKMAILNGISGFENLVDKSRTELEAFEKLGPASDWGDARSRTQRTIASAESSFDSLALRYGITAVEPRDRK
jgi:hypothetical protein